MEAALLPCRIKSSTGALSIEGIFSCVPAAAVPVKVKMPDPITAPMPNAIRLQTPSVLFSDFDPERDSSINESMLLVFSS